MKTAGVYVIRYGISMVLLVIIFCPHQSQCVKLYDGHQVIRVTPQTEDHVTSLRELLQSRNDVDVWKESSVPGEEVHIHLGPDAIEDFKVHLAKRSLGHEIMIEDTQAVIDNEPECCSHDKSLNSGDDFDNCYHTLDRIHEELHRLEEDHSNLVKVRNLDQSFEGRDMLGIEISQTGPETHAHQGLIIVTCGIHAREWISPATCMYIVRQLMNSKDSDEGIADMLNTFKWLFLPVLNVDGYEYTHKVDRLWRKNRRILDSSNCIGVDLNRNFASKDWGKQKCINDTCCETYPGEKAFSEKESANVAAYLADHSSELIAFFDLHSYLQAWLSPWARSNDKPLNYSKMERVMNIATQAIKDTSGKQYVYGPAYSTAYPAYGITVDYTYDTLGITHAYTVELRPADLGNGEDDTNGFLLPACEIIPTGKEIMAALKAITPILAKEKKKK